VAVVLDLFSRRVVGWSMSAMMTAELVTNALMMAFWRRGRPRELLNHFDRGSQYTSEQRQRLMAEHGIQCSLSRAGNVWDNVAERSAAAALAASRTVSSPRTLPQRLPVGLHRPLQRAAAHHQSLLGSQVLAQHVRCRDA
jgi:transposase InsO family protein